MKSIAGHSTPKNISTLTHDDLPFSDAALANLFNDKFVEVRSSLPRLSWPPLPIEEFHLCFTSHRRNREGLASSKTLLDCRSR